VRPARLLRLGLVLAGLGVAGCATAPRSALEAGVPPEDARAVDEAASLLAIPDPLEPFNRAMYRFNYELDHYVLLPTVNAYRAVVPRPVRTGISNFFSNLTEIPSATNGLLQARPEVASRAVIRFLVNSTVGVLGLFDVAGALGVEQQREDFGQTLGWWGTPAGPFLVLPVLGPSGVRDASGLAVDTAATLYLPPGSEINDRVYGNPAVLGVFVLDQRYVNAFRYFGSGSAFEYDLVRFLYRQQREFEIAR
jgi:phospholipid-binding lipoprotein MlaA